MLFIAARRAPPVSRAPGFGSIDVVETEGRGGKVTCCHLGKPTCSQSVYRMEPGVPGSIRKSLGCWRAPFTLEDCNPTGKQMRSGPAQIGTQPHPS